ncbi:MAG: hypothetical protein QOG68_1106, partial [Solirubrobacteraceae bacterium]|nr:hypothetical protein [Solirubrobacteraceae bacterium]
GSADPEARYGGGIASYHWNFGDGQTADTATATTTHAFAGKQTYTVTVTVTDKQGASSAASAPVSVAVADGVPPAVTIGKPAQKQKVKLYRTKKGKHGKVVHTKQRVAVTFLGGATDDVGVGRVVLALRPAGLTKGKCRWFDGKTSLKTADCTAPILLEASFLGGGWRYSLPLKAKLPPGPYVLVVAAVDSSGLAGPVRAVTFRLT